MLFVGPVAWDLTGPAATLTAIANQAGEDTVVASEAELLRRRLHQHDGGTQGGGVDSHSRCRCRPGKGHSLHRQINLRGDTESRHTRGRACRSVDYCPAVRAA
jgi:hypothetical protein